MERKGILLAGGSGTRLYPMTMGTSKQLLAVYDKPMLYYPLSVLFLAGIRDILVISTPHDLPNCRRLLGDGSRFGVRFSYLEQQRPDGIAQAFLLAEPFLSFCSTCQLPLPAVAADPLTPSSISTSSCSCSSASSSTDLPHPFSSPPATCSCVQPVVCIHPSALVLGDNLFFGEGIQKLLLESNQQLEGATVFGHRVDNPERYGVIELDDHGNFVSIEEKPEHPRSSFAVTGLYFYDGRAVEFAKLVQPSARGELEITDLNQMYADKGDLHVKLLPHGYAWMDMGTCETLFASASFVRQILKRQGINVGCLEEVALKNGWIDKEHLTKLCRTYASSTYGTYIANLLSSS